VDPFKSAPRALRTHAAFSSLLILLLALGADTANIRRWMLRFGGIAVGAGLVVGLTVATSRLLASLLPGVTGPDPAVLAFGVAGLALIGLAACLLPALRATRVNPVDALRSEQQ
jgi:ABC-type antimicrobial peptide transport system permease subunit